MNYRLISEGRLTEEWDGIDQLVVITEAMSPQGRRALLGLEQRVERSLVLFPFKFLTRKFIKILWVRIFEKQQGRLHFTGRDTALRVNASPAGPIEPHLARQTASSSRVRTESCSPTPHL